MNQRSEDLEMAMEGEGLKAGGGENELDDEYPDNLFPIVSWYCNPVPSFFLTLLCMCRYSWSIHFREDEEEKRGKIALYICTNCFFWVAGGPITIALFLLGLVVMFIIDFFITIAWLVSCCWTTRSAPVCHITLAKMECHPKWIRYSEFPANADCWSITTELEEKP
eukprot:TRINITY_DN2860_c0_g1_i1.p1 TRINITY_DN2860_c0_g1~~TRINITY_DN2860_c0_g1_i1.p1  ORF type:complete len:186 (+),score=24.25 TRINITY_DN2860_c0_g1_i1:61-558(+)